MSKSYILAHDIGTSGNKALLYDTDGRLLDSEIYEYTTYYPAAGCAEQDCRDWWKAVCITTGRLLERTEVLSSSVEAVSFSAQMMGCLPLDRSGEPLRRSMIWADNRSAPQALRLGETVGSEHFYHIAGARPSASYYGSKIMWLRENERELYDKTEKIMQAKDYIIYKLTGAFVTDYSDASGSNLFDINKREWSDELISTAGLRRSVLPDAYPSTAVAGRVTREAAFATGLCEGTPVVIGAGDGAAACVGAGAWRNGSIYCSVGSSAWISMASGEPHFDAGMQTYNIVHPDERLFAPCCSMQAAGYSLNWLRATFFNGTATRYDDMTAEAATAPAGANGIIYMPYLMGERCPRWNPEAYGGFLGLSLKNSKADMIRAVLEGVACNLRLILDIFGERSGNGAVIMVSGGAKSAVWLQIFADIFGRRLTVPENIGEATSIGAAICGGVGTGIYGNFGVCEEFNRTVREITPNPCNYNVYTRLLDVFERFYNGVKDIYPLLTDIKNI
jgi:xylulokinase